MSNLFDSLELGPLTLPNRMVMAPLTRNRAEGTIPNELMATYYGQRSGAGLIVTEATQVHPHGQGYPNTPGIHSDEQVAGWKEITSRVHEEGGRIFLQLWHVGRISHSSHHDGELPLAPSAVRPDGQAMTATGELVPFETPRALETDEIPGIVEQYRRGAERAKEAGFDGVEIHGANGYLIDQFLQTGTNQRTDRYGGSLENRLRFMREVIEAVLTVWDAERVGIRLSPAGAANDMSDDDPAETFTAAARLVEDHGLVYLHVVEGEVGGRSATQMLRGAYDGRLITTGGYDEESGAEVLRDRAADLVGYGRLFISNPDLPERFRTGAELNEWDRTTFYGGGAEGYVDYPALDEQVSV